MAYAHADHDRRLAFREDGTFTIVQFTDLHWQNGEKDDLLTRRLMARVLEAEKPDLAVLTGDVLFGGKCRDPARSLREATEALAQAGVPWAAVLGNHDDEGAMPRPELMRVLAGLPFSLAASGPANVHGDGNYVATVADREGRARLAFYFLDSGSYSSIPSIPGYDWIRGSQIDWYRRQAAELASANGGEPLPSLAFFHIPLPEYEQVWRKQRCYGHRHEKPAAPQVNSGLFAAMLETGGMMGTFCGHDHVNDYWGELGGIRLTYGRLSGYHAYGRLGFRRGARLIRLRLGEPGFETWLRLADGTVIDRPKVHKP